MDFVPKSVKYEHNPPMQVKGVSAAPATTIGIFFQSALQNRDHRCPVTHLPWILPRKPED